MQRAVEPGGAGGAGIDLDWRRVREFVVHNFGDAVAYQRDSVREGSAYTAVHRIISSRLRALKTALADRTAPIMVVAHSLGAHMMSNYIWDRQRRRRGEPDALEDIPTLVSVISFATSRSSASPSHSRVRFACPEMASGNPHSKPRPGGSTSWIATMCSAGPSSHCTGRTNPASIAHSAIPSPA